MSDALRYNFLALPQSYDISITGMKEVMDKLKARSSSRFYKLVSERLVRELAWGAKKKIVSSIREGAVFRPPVSRHILSSFITVISDSDVEAPHAQLVVKGKAPIPGHPRWDKFRGAGDFIKPHIEGLNIHRRPFKWFEVELQKRGILGPRDHVIRQTEERLERKVSRILFQSRSKRYKGERYFILRAIDRRHKGLSSGIWRESKFSRSIFQGSRVRKRVSPVFLFYGDFVYAKKPFNLYEEIDNYVKHNYVRKLEYAMKVAADKERLREFTFAYHRR